MKKLVRFEKAESGLSIYFDSCFPNEIEISIDKTELLRLGKLLLRLGEKKRGFVWKSKAEAPWGVFAFKVSGDKKPSLRFEYQIHNKFFKTVSDCENFYDNVSHAGILQFGEELLSLDTGKSANLYEFK